MGEEEKIKEVLSKHLEGGEAFLPLEAMLNKISFEKLGERPSKLPYSIYDLFYHIRFAQKDILDYCTLKSYKTHNWPQDYWPKQHSPNTKEDWEEIKRLYFEERKHLIQHLVNENQNLVSPVRNETDHSLLREILLVIEHTAYHTGQILILMRILGLHSTGNERD